MSACSPGAGSPEGRPGGGVASGGSHGEFRPRYRQGAVEVERAEPGKGGGVVTKVTCRRVPASFFFF